MRMGLGGKEGWRGGWVAGASRLSGPSSECSLLGLSNLGTGLDSTGSVWWRGERRSRSYPGADGARAGASAPAGLREFLLTTVEEAGRRSCLRGSPWRASGWVANFLAGAS